MKENLDLKLTPYKVLATSSKHGESYILDNIYLADKLMITSKAFPSKNNHMGYIYIK